MKNNIRFFRYDFQILYTASKLIYHANRLIYVVLRANFMNNTQQHLGTR